MKNDGPWLPDEKHLFSGLAKIKKKTKKSFNSKRGNTEAVSTVQPRNSFEKSIQKCKFVPKLINY